MTSSYWVHHIDPVALHIGPLAVHWYGLMYMLGFMLFYFLGCRRLKHGYFQQKGWTSTWVEDFLSYGIMGVILGGRLGYVLFYKPMDFLSNPIEVIRVWHGGMSFHGGLIGVIIAFIVFAKKTGRPFLEIADFVAPLVPTGLGAGRLGNFINGELWGHPTHVPWAVIFPLADDQPRHPSQIYEFLGEGIILFSILWWAGQQPWAEKHRGRISALFLIGYAIARITVECFREPDRFLPSLPLHLSMGQWLSLPMLLAGIILWYKAPSNVPVNSQTTFTVPEPR